VARSPNSAEHIAVLIAGASHEHAMAWVQELRHGGFDLRTREVGSEGDLKQVLAEERWDVILAPVTGGPIHVGVVSSCTRALGLTIPVIGLDGTSPPAGAEPRSVTSPDTASAAEPLSLVEHLRRSAAWLRSPGGRQDEARFRRLADQAPAMLWMTNAAGEMVFLNQRWLEFRGRSLEQEVGGGWELGVHEDDVAACRRALARAHRDQDGFTQEFRLRRWDDDHRWLLSTGAPQFDRDGAFMGLIGSCVDITDRRRWEEGLRQRDRLLQAVAQATHLLLTGGELDQSIPGMLRTLGEAMDVDRAYIFRNRSHPKSGEPLTDQLFEWCSGRTEPQIGNPDLQGMAFDPMFTRLLRSLQAGKPYTGVVSDFPDTERAFLQAQHIRSILCVPIQVGQSLWGFLGFDDCHRDRVWSVNEEALIHTMAGSLGALFGRRDSERLLDARDRLLRGVAQATHELLHAPDLDQALRRALELLGEAAAVDRVYLFENTFDGRSGLRSLQARFLWTRNVEERKAPTPRSIAYDELLPRWYDILAAGQPISGLILDFLHEPDRETPPDLRSILLVPVISGDRFWGVAGFDDTDLTRAWNASDEDLLKTVAGSIGAAIARRGAEETLRAREEHYRSLIENVSDVIAIVDGQGILTYLSPAVERTLGYQPSELAGRSAGALLHPEDAFNLMQVRKVMLSQPAAIRMAEFRLRHRDGSWRYFESAAKQLESRGGQRFYVINARDITERRKTEDALRHSEELLRHSQKMEAVGRLAGGVAHDFNNLLTAISGYTDLLMEELPAGHAMRHELEEISKAAERAHGLTRQLLAFSRKQVLEPRLMNLNTIVLDLQKMLRRLIGEDIELVTELDPDPGLTRVDAGQMEQMIINLSVNARDAMPCGGRLILRTTRIDLMHRLTREPYSVEPGAYIVLEVCDNGKGMDPSIKERIFEPFFTTKEVGKGTGLGLSMVYGIVQQSGGSILVDSTPGQGSTFSIYLPRVDGQEAAPPRAEAHAHARGTESILLVEDEDMVRQLAAKLLVQQGYRVVAAANGREALRIAEEQGARFDLLLTDIVMPFMGGTSLAEQMRKRFPGIRILYMSGYAQDALIESSDVKPGLNFLQKPFKPAALSALVREVLDAR
jgi:PAS domain S-box-containing protein